VKRQLKDGFNEEVIAEGVEGNDER